MAHSSALADRVRRHLSGRGGDDVLAEWLAEAVAFDRERTAG